ncbi:MAG: hypothetical protein JEY99_05620 [Spirochaetales bacterium]|nr:hypothetical protein [Spirochaetales bacterium]
MKESKSLIPNKEWLPPNIEIKDVVSGDMPGDKVSIDETHTKRADRIFPYLLNSLQNTNDEKIVISVYGGSGVGKSEIGALLGHYAKLEGFPAYVLSGDNYPFRIPSENDRERLNIYRYEGLKALAEKNDFSDRWVNELKGLWETMEDANPARTEGRPWFELYQNRGKEALYRYLGTEAEIDFPLINNILNRFKQGEAKIALKRMGRTPDELSFEAVDFSDIKLLIVEWTHGNNPSVEGVDIPLYLYSTPEETLAHRLARGRDKGTDSPFINIVLKIEQERLNSQINNAALIVTKEGNIIKKDEINGR